MKFEAICLITEDVPALTRFYEEVLQTTAEGDAIHAEIRTEGASLSIYSRAAAKEDMKLQFGSSSGNFTMGFLVEDVDQEYERLHKLGVTIMSEPTTYGWGRRSMQFQDLDGNVISFASILGH
ncbi:MAG TPA: VOC family protein [Mobilitalea sp.]|nr:VOC family protein [Mobilitalea sp.]